MDAYLEIAIRVLRDARQPLRPREILRRGLTLGVVPARLYGKTQHKTLQARLSEDILIGKERSPFFRTKPGYFFLREFLTDTTIPIEHRTPIVARRRRRELAYPETLAFDQSTLERLCSLPTIAPDKVLSLLKEQRYHYARSSRDRHAKEVLVWAFILVVRDNFVLTYRHGRYREDRDSFLQKRSLGFFSPVVHNDLTLFDQIDHGIVASGMRALNQDLNLTSSEELEKRAALNVFVCTNENGPRDLLALVDFHCPDWFEPFTRRLAINDLQWQNIDLPVNHLEDFDPWSQLVLERAQPTIGKTKKRIDEATHR